MSGSVVHTHRPQASSVPFCRNGDTAVVRQKIVGRVVAARSAARAGEVEPVSVDSCHPPQAFLLSGHPILLYITELAKTPRAGLYYL
jgi:hypothetical protein